eukprot:7260318-Ditylum_brightwellii.AAC.1
MDVEAFLSNVAKFYKSCAKGEDWKKEGTSKSHISSTSLSLINIMVKGVMTKSMGKDLGKDVAANMEATLVVGSYPPLVWLAQDMDKRP